MRCVPRDGAVPEDQQVYVGVGRAHPLLTALLAAGLVDHRHAYSGKERREERMRAAFPDVDLLVFGHSHIPWDTTHRGLRLLNPGSPTDRRRQPHCTYLTARIVDAEVTDVVLHRLPPRGS